MIDRNDNRPKILLLCSRPNDISYYEKALTVAGYEDTIVAHSGQTAAAVLKNEKVSVVLIDNLIYPEGGLYNLQAIKRDFPKISCVIIVKQDEVDTAVQALGMGADDYMIKDELFAGSLSEIMRRLTRSDFFRYGFDEQDKGRALLPMLRRALLLSKRISVHLSYQPEWESLSDEVYDVYGCDAWGYVFEDENRSYGSIFRRGPMEDDALSRLVSKCSEVYDFHSGKKIDPKSLDLRIFQKNEGDIKIVWPYKDFLLPLFAEGRPRGLAFMIYQSPKRATPEKAALFEFMANLISVALENGFATNRLLRLSMFDKLTECYNREFFLKQLDRESVKVERYKGLFSLLLIDVDDFKRINRSYGYEAGTAALVHLASVIKDETRLIDIIARIGGEEFAVILPDTDLNGAKTVANRVKEKIKNQPFRLAAGAEIKITSTVAAGQYSPQVHKSGEGLLIRLERLLAHKGENGDSVIIEN